MSLAHLVLRHIHEPTYPHYQSIYIVSYRNQSVPLHFDGMNVV